MSYRDEVTKAMRRAFQLGQIYWQQAVSERYRETELTESTRHDFEVVLSDTAAAVERADARIAELERECLQWGAEMRIYRETENKRIAELEQSVTVRDTEIARLETDLEFARRDAERYRWLRDHYESPRGARDVYASIHDWSRSIDPAARFNMWSHIKVSGQHLDEAIDKARAGNGGVV